MMDEVNLVIGIGQRAQMVGADRRAGRAPFHGGKLGANVDLA